MQVVGDIGARLGAQGRLDQPLDGKAAVTEYRVLDWDAAANRSTLAVRIQTGRLHQIRRHLADAGFPVLGDPRYGQGNKSAEGLRLAAVGLTFSCPRRKQPVEYQLDAADVGF